MRSFNWYYEYRQIVFKLVAQALLDDHAQGPLPDGVRLYLVEDGLMHVSFRITWHPIPMVFRPTAGVVLISVKPTLQNVFTLQEWPALIEDMPET